MEMSSNGKVVEMNGVVKKGIIKIFSA